jgi:serine/threonine protein kinase
MALYAGTHLGRYVVHSLLGAGGMGEVYLAKDTKLDRHVALKILRPTATANPERLSRFVQEARAAAALNHPTSRISTRSAKPMASTSWLWSSSMARLSGKRFIGSHLI